jgi:hypothetical protein
MLLPSFRSASSIVRVGDLIDDDGETEEQGNIGPFAANGL